MEAVSEFAGVKAQLEARIAGLERERAALQKEVKSLSERLATKQLERGQVPRGRGQPSQGAEDHAAAEVR